MIPGNDTMQIYIQKWYIYFLGVIFHCKTIEDLIVSSIFHTLFGHERKTDIFHTYGRVLD